MPNTQYTPYPMTDWSSEISGGSPAGGGSPTGGGSPASAPQASAHASATTSTTTTTTSSVSAGHPAAASAPNMTTTTTTNQAAAPAAQTQAPAQADSAPAAQARFPVSSRNEFSGSTGTLDLETHQPIEVIEAPASLNEAFLGSLKSMLLRNRGNFVTATFLIGTQGTTAWEGILHDVGNDYVIIFQPGRQRYIACDIYSLKYIEFYDTRQREMCEHLLRQNGMNNFY